MDTAGEIPVKAPDGSDAGVPVAVIVAGGESIVATSLRVPDDAHVIAADSGLDEAERLGLTPMVVIGDLDSVDADALARARRSGVPVLQHPVDKDETDLELALTHARNSGYRKVILIGGHGHVGRDGDRLSHLLGNALVLASEPFADIEIAWHVGATTVSVVRPGRPGVFEGQPGELVSLIVVGGDATDVTTEGLRWRLTGATLGFGSTRGISNEMTSTAAAVSISTGVILAVHERLP